jgi:hypothetical protein
MDYKNEKEEIKKANIKENCVERNTFEKSRLSNV